MTPGGRQHVATRALRIAAALLVLWGTLHLLFHLGGGPGGWPPDESALGARAALTARPEATAAAWRVQIESRAAILAELRAAFTAEPNVKHRRELSVAVVSLLDKPRAEIELYREASMGRPSRAIAYRRHLRTVLRGSPIAPEELGEPLGLLVRLRFADRLSSPGIPLVEDEFREKLTAWLAGG